MVQSVEDLADELLAQFASSSSPASASSCASSAASSSASSPTPSECAACLVPAVSGSALLRCGRCKRAWYCGRQCQRSHWLKHKQVCRASSASATPTPAKPNTPASAGKPTSALSTMAARTPRHTKSAPTKPLIDLPGVDYIPFMVYAVPTNKDTLLVYTTPPRACEKHVWKSVSDAMFPQLQALFPLTVQFLLYFVTVDPSSKQGDYSNYFSMVVTERVPRNEDGLSYIKQHQAWTRSENAALTCLQKASTAASKPLAYTTLDLRTHKLHLSENAPMGAQEHTVVCDPTKSEDEPLSLIHI